MNWRNRIVVSWFLHTISPTKMMSLIDKLNKQIQRRKCERQIHRRNLFLDLLKKGIAHMHTYTGTKRLFLQILLVNWRNTNVYSNLVFWICSTIFISCALHLFKFTLFYAKWNTNQRIKFPVSHRNGNILKYTQLNASRG